MKLHTRMLAASIAPLTAISLAGLTFAGTDPATPADSVSGVLKLDLNTHYVSYGGDTWGDGNPDFDELNFNPALELAFALPAGWKATAGTWWDVNGKGGSDSLGGNLREVDVWAGLSYSYSKFSVGVVAQDWFYGSASEEIVDVNLSYACFLSPTLVIHNRLGAGASGGDEGTVLVAGISHGFQAGPVAFSFPLNIAYFATPDFHGPGAHSGFGYASVGAGASLPLEPYLGNSYGKWTLNAGLTYYFTDRDIAVNNVKSDFLTANLGLAVAF